jgi:gas vesicle protein
MPDNPMGAGHAGAEPTGKSVTNKTFQEAGKAMDESAEESKRNALDLLKKVLGEKPAKVVKDPSGYDRYDDA